MPSTDKLRAKELIVYFGVIPKLSNRRGGGETGRGLTPCSSLREGEEETLGFVLPVLPIGANSGEDKKGLERLSGRWYISRMGERASREKHIVFTSLS